MASLPISARYCRDLRLPAIIEAALGMAMSILIISRKPALHDRVPALVHTVCHYSSPLLTNPVNLCPHSRTTPDCDTGQELIANFQRCGGHLPDTKPSILLSMT